MDDKLLRSKLALVDYWANSRIISSRKLIDVFLKIPRENFVNAEHIDNSYEDRPLPILLGQTISQPTTMMIMTESLELDAGHKVLEIGTGSGYQAAILSETVGPTGKVISTEIVPELVELAKGNLRKSGITDVEVIKYDGSKGYEKEAPYDRIIVTAGCPRIPKPLFLQLKENGIIIAPVGDLFSQLMIKGKKKGNELITSNLGYFVFVPLKGKFGHQ